MIALLTAVQNGKKFREIMVVDGKMEGANG